jgi:hypothetical protein
VQFETDTILAAGIETNRPLPAQLARKPRARRLPIPHDRLGGD